MKYIKILFILIFFYTLITNKDFFLWYNYEKYECDSNKLRINDITIAKDKLGSKIEISIRDFLHIFIVMISTKNNYPKKYGGPNQDNY